MRPGGEVVFGSGHASILRAGEYVPVEVYAQLVVPFRRRIDTIQIAGARPGTDFDLPWGSRGALLVRLRRQPGAARFVRAFEAAGTTGTVVLNEREKALLAVIIGGWLEEVGDASRLPAGIAALADALSDRHTQASA